MAWEIALRTLGPTAGRDVVHAVGPQSALSDALDRAGCRRIEADVDPDSGEPLWPGPESAAVVLEHRHAMPARPPALAPVTRMLEDATTALAGSVAARPVGSLGNVVVMVLGPPLCPRSAGAVVATAHDGAADALRQEPNLTALDDVVVRDAALRADLRSVDDRVAAFQAAAAVYDSAWRGKRVDLRALQPPDRTTSSRSEYIIGVPDPDGLAAVLAQEGVETRRPLNARLWRLLSDPADAFSGARAFYARALQIPNHPGLDLGELLFVADVVVRYLRAAHA